MNLADSHKIAAFLQQHFPDCILQSDHEVLQPWLQVKKENLVGICELLHAHEDCYFDFLSCLSGVDDHSNKLIGVVYHLYSIPHERWIVLKCFTDREATEADLAVEGNAKALPVIPSVSAVWRSAEWHEREVYDLFGIYFAGHPDLRRMFMPEDWPGYPLRKDYEDPDTYHNVKVLY